jgi:uncharacterized SAM-binding protein YcdF (DUF218 family)
MKIPDFQRRQRGGIIFRLVFLLFVLILCMVVYLARHPLLRFAGESWVVEDPLQHADVLVVLSDDNFYADRATRAAELFRQGFAPVVVASGRRLRPNAGIAELMEHDLVERGVPKENIVRFVHDADNTREEAEALAPFVAQRKWRSVIVVTSNVRTRRTRYIFQRVFAPEIAARVASARNGDFDAAHWYEKRKSIKELMGELGGMLVAMWELRGKGSPSGQAQSVVGLAGGKLLLAV